MYLTICLYSSCIYKPLIVIVTVFIYNLNLQLLNNACVTLADFDYPFRGPLNYFELLSITFNYFELLAPKIT